MTNYEDGTMTPQKVKELATQEVRLPRTALIGIFGSQAAPGALIRNSDGTFARVNVGDRAIGGVVAAIDETRVIISIRDSTKVLELPAV